jgi:hypothetical protein
MSEGGQFTTRVTEQFLRGTNVPTENVQIRLLLYDFETGNADVRSNHT